MAATAALKVAASALQLTVQIPQTVQIMAKALT